MASRALRKLQKERELEKQLAAARSEAEDEEDEEDQIVPSISQPKNAFDMLEAAETGDDSQEGSDDSNSGTKLQTPPESAQSIPKPKSKRKKKKQKKKAKEKPEEAVEKLESGDEIDRALRELAVKNEDQNAAQIINSWETTATKHLSIDQKNLDPVNEMRGLFGSIAVEGESRHRPQNQRRRELNLQGGLDLATALTGRYSVASKGKELGTLAKRKNFFMQGREEWPLATSGGLSMENLPVENFERRFNVVHNQLYKETQFQFRMAVESMQPENMINLLAKNPYHIASLLQVSEIAKHQGDNSVAGDLLERALYTFGRSLHSTFPSAMREGSARMPFGKPANRELYLTIWRYIRNLEQRGTWRTAFEWSKMLLQLNTLSDPFGVTLMIDQLALRGRQHDQLIELASNEAYGNAWKHLPNIQISLALAFLKAQKPKEARNQLAVAMHHYPYILAALASELEITPIPKAIWGKLPASDAEKLYTQLYATRAKDLWNTPETIGLISEVANTLSFYKTAIDESPVAPNLEISLEEARHIMLLEIPALIALLPRTFTGMPTSSTDVLPPPDSLSDFLTARAPTDASGPAVLQNIFSAAGTGAVNATGNLFQRVLDWFHAPGGPSEARNENGETEGQAALRELREQMGGQNVPDEVIEELLQRSLAQGLQQGINAEDLGLMGNTPGDWDYYENSTDEEDDDGSMPELEGEEVEPPTLRGPHAATVEAVEDDDDDDGYDPAVAAEYGFVPAAGDGRTPLGRAILRHVDSESENEADEPRPHPQPTHTIFAPIRQQQANTPAINTNNPVEMPADPIDISNVTDPQRIQRWLITTGLTDLQISSSSAAMLGKYVDRLKVLNRQQQNWVLNMVTQRSGKDLADKIRERL